MDPGDLTQLIFVTMAALVLGRVGLSVARLIDRRAIGKPSLPEDAEARFRALESECDTLRHELAEVQERQDFTERALLHDPARVPAAGPPPARDRISTPK